MIVRLTQDSHVSKLKEVTYRGGLLRFALPEHWVEEYAPEGGGTFYTDEPGSGTLRLSVITFAGPSQPDRATLLKAVQHGGIPEMLSTGNALVRYSEEASEAGIPLTVFYWEIANSVPPRHLRLALFSYTVGTRHARESKTQREVEMLDSLIRTAEFSPELGVFGSGPDNADLT
jgi:hypothetical protein